MQKHWRALSCGIILLLLLAVSAGCASSKSISRQDLKEEVERASSLAAESALFTDLKIKGKTTHAYSQEHQKYLAHKAAEMVDDFGRSRPEADISEQFHSSRSILKELSDSINRLQSDDDTQLYAEKAKLEAELHNFQIIIAGLQ
jgi:hypothetical protein